ncbi:MAG: hypothetical protein WAT19_03860 [Ferruginibacter sp.]
MLKKSLLILLALVLLDLLAGFLLRKLYFSQKSNPLYRTTYTLHKVNKELIVLGSSRANHHYSDSVLSTDLQKTYYNGGIDGEFFLYSYAMLHGITKRYKPSLVIIDVNPDALSKRVYNSSSSAKLRPYYREDRFYLNMAGRFDAYEKIKAVSTIFPFNGKLFSMIYGNLRTDPTDTIGYFPLYGSKDSAVFFNRKAAKTVQNDPRLELMFEECINMAGKNNIKLVILISPLYEYRVQDDASVNKMKELCAKYNTPLLDFGHSINFAGKKELFYDIDHLNNEGAIRFSKELAQKLKELKLL